MNIRSGLVSLQWSKEERLLAEGRGYITVRKGYVGKTPRTWLALTEDGRRALADHVAALQEIADTAARHAG